MWENEIEMRFIHLASDCYPPFVVTISVSFQFPRMSVSLAYINEKIALIPNECQTGSRKVGLDM